MTLVGERTDTTEWRLRGGWCSRFAIDAVELRYRRQDWRRPLPIEDELGLPRRRRLRSERELCSGNEIAGPLIDRCARDRHRPVRAKDVRVRLRVSDGEPPAIDEALVEPAENPFDDLPVEIDHHVAAQDEIERRNAMDHGRVRMLDEVVVLIRHPVFEERLHGPRRARWREPEAFDF